VLLTPVDVLMVKMLKGLTESFDGVVVAKLDALGKAQVMLMARFIWKGIAAERS